MSHHIVWGFLLGFTVSTVVHLLVITDNPKHLASMLVKDQAGAYQSMAQKNADGTYTQSYSDYQQQYSRVKTMFYIAALLFCIVLSIGMIRIWG